MVGGAAGLWVPGTCAARLQGGCRVPVRLASGPAAMAEDERPAAAGGGASHRRQAADFEQFEAERLELREHAVQRRPVRQRPGQHSVAAARPGLQ